ncbi:MAG: hypothetical protein KME46_01785 [Brasilonema angustatum HA4187-MV1]|nr:hypothetical protein [Brasilonema angustatum HA4187-MV1]
MTGLEHSTLFKAQELQETISKIEKSASESVVELLTMINGEEVQSEELHKMDKVIFQKNTFNKEIANEIIAHSKKLRTHSQELETRYKKLACQFVNLKTCYTEFKKNWTQLRKTTK